MVSWVLDPAAVGPRANRLLCLDVRLLICEMGAVLPA